jgi:hypothetical protein
LRHPRQKILWHGKPHGFTLVLSPSQQEKPFYLQRGDEGMFCQRFGLEVYFTRHARERMLQRNISEEEISYLLENGKARYKDDVRLWIAMFFPDRNDNLICVAVALEEKVIVKTVMHHFQWEVES